MTSRGLRPRSGAMAVSAIVLAVLFTNAIGLAQATHEHGPLHDRAKCPVWAIQAVASWAPSAPPVPPVPAGQRESMPTLHVVYPEDTNLLVTVCRGPPAI